jgi:hypothetical protein
MMDPQLSPIQELLELPPPIPSGSGSESESPSDTVSLKLFVSRFRLRPRFRPRQCSSSRFARLTNQSYRRCRRDNQSLNGERQNMEVLKFPLILLVPDPFKSTA